MEPRSKKESVPPNADAVLKRAAILKHLFVKGLATPPPSVLAQLAKKWTQEEQDDFTKNAKSQFAAQIQKLREGGLWSEMNETERRFIEAGPLEVSEQEILETTWLSEAAVCLLWALEYVPKLPPYDERANPELTNQDFSKKPILRSFEEIRKQRDLAELWHWRARTRQLQELGRMPSVISGGMTIAKVLQLTSTKAAENGAFQAPIGGDFPAFEKAYRDLSADEFSLATSIVMERHRALNWLCGYAPENRWADTPTDT